MGFKKVAVLLGGMSSEREVSLASGRAVAAGLRRSGFDVVEIDVTHEPDKKLRDSGVEAAFIALHGKFGEDGAVQGLLEMCRIPYTGSGVCASAVAMDKSLTRALAAAVGIPMAKGVLLKATDERALPPGWSLPVVVKPPADGSSVGVSIVKTPEAFSASLEKAFETKDRMLVEQFVAGREIQVAILDEKVLGAVEIEPLGEFYDYEAKYTPGGAVHHIPPRVSEALTKKCRDTARQAYDAIGCAGLARVDLIAPPDGPPILLEVNTIPGMTELSLAPEIAAAAGISFDELVKAAMNRATLHT